MVASVKSWLPCLLGALYNSPGRDGVVRACNGVGLVAAQPAWVAVGPIDRGTNMGEPLVSVCTITYNHEAYLRQAIESVLAQQTSFDFELVIGEDCSTDQTREIALEYQKAHPDVVRVLRNTARLGAMKNFEHTLAACRSKYVAFLDGDDFWTSPQKLQRQVDVLEAHRDISVVFHPVHIVPEPEPGQARVFPRWVMPQRTSIRDVLRGIYMHTSSLMVRNPHFDRMPSWYHEMYMSDWPLVVLCARHGDIYCIPEPMASYRQTGSGIWSPLSIRRISALSQRRIGQEPLKCRSISLCGLLPRRAMSGSE